MLREAFSDRRIRNAGTFKLNQNVNSFQSNLEFRKMGTHQMNVAPANKNNEALIKNVSSMLADFNTSKNSVSVYPDVINYGILAKG